MGSPRHDATPGCELAEARVRGIVSCDEVVGSPVRCGDVCFVAMRCYAMRSVRSGVSDFFIALGERKKERESAAAVEVRSGVC